MVRALFWLVVIGVMAASCVPNRKYVYLQKDDVNKKANELPKDTILRTYDLNIQEYKIQPLDILSIRMESLTDDEFNFVAKLYPNTDQQTGGGGGGANAGAQMLNGFLVDNQGEIAFPVIGRVQFAGLSIFQAELKLQQLLKPYLKDPVVRIRLLNFRFTILGEVRIENQIVSANPRVTLVEAIGMAGGLTDLADRANVKIIRQKGNNSQVLYMNLLDEELLSTENYYIQQNDIIVVPALRQRPFRKYWGENLALFVSTVSVVLLTISLFQNN